MSSHDPTVPSRPGGGDTSFYAGGLGDEEPDGGPSLTARAVVAACGMIALVAFILVVFVFLER